MASKTIRVDREVYAEILKRKHQLEREHGRQVSINDAVRAVLEEMPPESDSQQQG